MTKQMIKAIRLVNGWNPDLRVKLNTVNKSSLYDWIEANRYGIFDSLDEAMKPDTTSPEWVNYERRIWNAVHAVINGTSG